MNKYEMEIKRDAYRDIDNMFKEGNSAEVIIFKLQTRYGFSANMIKKRIELLEKLAESNEGE